MSVEGGRREPWSEYFAPVERSALQKAEAAVGRVRELHVPFGIYDECEHEHTQAEVDDDDSPVLDVDEVGLTCPEGLMYRVCEHCCVRDGYGQTEDCVGVHEHTKEGPICPTIAAVDGVEWPTGGTS